MASLLWVLFAVLLGCVVIYRWTGLARCRPVWAGWLLVFGVGAPLGIGLGSCVFLAIGVGLGSATAAMAVEIAVLVWCAMEAYRKRRDAGADRLAIPFPLLLPAAAALLLVAGTAIAGFAAAWDANPNGNWDAWAIWNLRARFLAADPHLASRAWSAELGHTTHAEYPLLISAFVARTWRYGRDASNVAPAATSFVFWLALMALTAGGIAALRGRSLGLLAALVLAASPAVLQEVPAQYADIPLACYIALSIVMALADFPLLAGIFAGLAAWTKDEGLLFAAVFVIAMAIFRRKSAIAAVLGALPGALLAIIFKLVAAQGTPSLVAAGSTGALQKIGQWGRWEMSASAYGRQFLNLGHDWYHPILPLAALAIVLRFDRARRRDMLFCGSIVAAMLAGYFTIFLITPNPLDWQLQTSLGRLFVQVWPGAIVAIAIGLTAPEASAVLHEVKVKAKKKGRP